MKRIILSSVLILLLSHFSFPQTGGYALQFSGTRHINCGNNEAVQISGSAITLEAWVYPTAFSTNYWDNVIVNKLSNTSHGFNLRCGGNGIVEFYAAYDFVTLNGVFSDASTLTLNKWTHLAGTYDGSTAKLYVNGRLVKSSPSASSISSTDLPLVIGNSGSGELTRPFIGSIDEVRIWNTVRTEAEIKANMYKEIGTHTNLKAYYSMSNGSGTSLTDNSGNSNTGTLTNGPEWKASGCFAGSRNALDFDGTDDFVDISNGVILGTSFTQEMWIYPKSSSAVYSGILGYQSGEPSTSRPPSIYQYGLNLHFGFADGTTWFSDNTTDAPLTLNSWNHVAMTFNGTTYLVYVNGRLRYTSLCASGQTPVSNPQRWIGKVDNYFYGSIDEIRIWNDVRTESEIRENMMKTLVGNETGLAAYYRFDYNDETTLYDLTSTARNGTLTNMDAGTDWVSSSAFNTWIGSESNSWSTAANWSSGTAPAATDNVGLYKWDLGNEASVSGIPAPAVNNLLFSSTASPVLSSDFRVNGNLLLGKNLDPNGRTITLGLSSNPGFLVEGDYRFYGSSGTISVESSWNNFSGVNVGGLGAVISCNTNITRTIIRGHAEYISGGNKSILRYYKIIEESKENTEVIEITLKFNYLESELNGLTESTLTLFKSTDNGSTWTNVGGVLDINNNNVTLTGISSIEGLWTLGSSASPLPVELTTFSAKTSGNGVLLSWKTATEVNNYGFEVERSLSSHSSSLNGHSLSEVWEKVGFVPGSGNSNSVKEYSFTDFPNHTSIQPYNHSFQYRLKQIDNDGTFAYSKEIEVENLRPSTFDLRQNYPNPFNPSTVISYQLPVKSFVSLKLYDITGNEIATLVNEEKEAGIHNYELRINNYPALDWTGELTSGVYFYQLRAGDFVSKKKLVLMK